MRTEEYETRKMPSSLDELGDLYFFIDRRFRLNSKLLVHMGIRKPPYDKNTLLDRKIIMRIYTILFDMHYQNNHKAQRIKLVLDEYNIKYSDVIIRGNRCRIHMKTATIKLALNSEGIIDNWEEFIQCVEFQPYMLKIYECNGLISICEPVNAFPELYKGEINNETL